MGIGDNSRPEYQSSKGAVRLLHQRRRCSTQGPHPGRNSVHPGPIIDAHDGECGGPTPRTTSSWCRAIPLGRYGEADEVAYGVLYLASEILSYVTGSELVIDGGWTAQ